jgi:hypothetical protein
VLLIWLMTPRGVYSNTLVTRLNNDKTREKLSSLFDLRGLITFTIQNVKQ